MIIVLIHWRICPDPKSQDEFLAHWKTKNEIKNRDGLIGEFLSESLAQVQYPWITWHLDPESIGDFKSYVTVGMWDSADRFQDEIAEYFNDGKPMLNFEKYRRRRVVFRPVAHRMGSEELPRTDSEGVI